MKIVLVLILTLIPFLGFAQEGNEGAQPEIQDEAAIQELEKNRELRQQNLETITEIVAPTAEENPQEHFTPADLLKTESLVKMEKMLKEANLSQHPPELIRDMIFEAFRGNPLEGYLRTSPKLQNFIVDMIRDEKVMISAIGILKNRPRLKIYLYFWIGIMFASYYTKRLFISKYWKRGTRTFAALLFSMTITTITLSTFCLLFKEEMKPILVVIKKHL